MSGILDTSEFDNKINNKCRIPAITEFGNKIDKYRSLIAKLTAAMAVGH